MGDHCTGISNVLIQIGSINAEACRNIYNGSPPPLLSLPVWTPSQVTLSHIGTLAITCMHINCRVTTGYLSMDTKL